MFHHFRILELYRCRSILEQWLYCMNSRNIQELEFMLTERDLRGCMQDQLQFKVIKRIKCHGRNLTIIVYSRHTLTSCRTNGKIHNKIIVLCSCCGCFKDCVIGRQPKSIYVPIRCNAKGTAVLKHCQFNHSISPESVLLDMFYLLQSHC